MDEDKKVKEALAQGYSINEIRSWYISKGQELPESLKTTQAETTGIQLPKAAKLGLTALQGPTLGFGEEIGAGIAAPFMRQPGETYTEAYKRLRDVQRSALESYREEYPIGAPVVQGIAGLPLGAVPLRLGAGVKGAAASGGVFGGIQAAGEAKSTEDIPADILTGALGGAVSGGGVELGRKVVAPVASSVKGRVTGMLPQRVQEYMGQSATDTARMRIAQAMLRDGATTEQVQARLSKLGDDAVLAEAAGTNLRDLLDTMATLPGRTKNLTEQLIRSRQVKRGERLGEAAQRELTPAGANYAQTIEELTTQRSVNSTPFYDQLRTMVVPIDDELKTILNAAEKLGAFKNAQRIATAERRPFSLKDAKNINEAAMIDLDLVKRGIDDLLNSSGSVNQQGKFTAFGNAVIDLKRSLLSRLDDATKDKSGNSVYQQARSAFAGPSAMIDAAELGRTILSKDQTTINQLLRGMGDSEMEAFRIGAAENLRMMAGTQAGQNKLLNMWKEPDTQEKLKQVFPSERSYRRFLSDVLAESRKREIQSVGRGSQTAGREARMEDLAAEQMRDVIGAAAAAKTMDLGTLLNMVSSGFTRTIVPEPVRNEIGRILLSRAQSADEIKAVRSAIERLKRNQQFVTGASGAIGAQVSSPFSQVFQSLLD